MNEILEKVERFKAVEMQHRHAGAWASPNSFLGTQLFGNTSVTNVQQSRKIC